MPQFRVTGPDGKTYDVTAPDGATEDEVIAQVQSHVGPAPTQPATQAAEKAEPGWRPQQKPDASDVFVRNYSLGLSDYVGATGAYLGDKAAAGAQTLAGQTPTRGDLSYEDALRGVRRSYEDYADENPGTNIAASVVGGVASPAFAMKAGNAATGVATNVTGSMAALVERTLDKGSAFIGRQLPMWFRTGVQGGVGGSLYGAGTAQNEQGGVPTLEDLGSSMEAGGGAGALFGGAAPYAFKAMGYVGAKAQQGGQAALDKLPFNQQSAGARKIAEALDADSITPQMLQANRQRLGQGTNLVDLAGEQDPVSGVWLGGRNTRMLADNYANAPGRTQNLAERVLKPRPATAGTDIMGSVERNVSSQQFYPRLDQLGAQKAADAAPRYSALYERFPVMSSPHLADLAGDPVIQQAAKAGERSLRVDALTSRQSPGAQTKPVFDLDPDGNVLASGSWSMQQWDAVKKGLGRMINNTRDQSGRLPKTDEVRDLVRLQSSLRDHLDDMTTVEGKSMYADAREAWAGPSALEDAMWQGRDFLRGDREVTAREFKKLGGDEQQAFMDGLAREIQGAIETTGTIPAKFKNILNAENGTRKLLKEILPADKFNAFMNDLAGVSRKLQATNIIGGSDTQRRLANAENVGSDLGGIVIDAAQGNVPGAARGIVRSAGNFLRTPSRGVRDEAGGLLLDPNRVDEAINLLNTRAQVGSRNPNGVLKSGAFSSENLLRMMPLGVR